MKTYVNSVLRMTGQRTYFLLSRFYFERNLYIFNQTRTFTSKEREYIKKIQNKAVTASERMYLTYIQMHAETYSTQ